MTPSETQAGPTVGFVGLGMMGLPMVEHLASDPGLTIRAHDSSGSQLERLRILPGWGAGLMAAPRLEDLAGCEVVIVMLPNSTITDSVVGGESGRPGLLQLLKPGAVVVDMGSSNPVNTQALAGLLAQADIALLDAPVSGSVAKARAGTLSIMVGGPEAAFQRVRALLERMGTTLIRTGASGSAHAMKALNNYVYAAGLLAVSEALLVARKMELDLEVFTDVLNASSGRNVATETKLRQFMISRTFNGGFALGLQAKDLATAHSLQQAAGTEAPQLELCTTLWRQAVAELEPGADNTSILRLLEKRSPAG